jgi:hypothetical protein
VIAELRGPPDAARQESAVERALRILGARAGLTVREPHDPAAYRPSPLKLAPGTAQALLEAERGER